MWFIELTAPWIPLEAFRAAHARGSRLQGGCPLSAALSRVSLAFPSRFLWGVRCPPGQSFEIAGWIHQLFVSAPWRARYVWQFGGDGLLLSQESCLRPLGLSDFRQTMWLAWPARPSGAESVRLSERIRRWEVPWTLRIRRFNHFFH